MKAFRIAAGVGLALIAALDFTIVLADVGAVLRILGPIFGATAVVGAIGLFGRRSWGLAAAVGAIVLDVGGNLVYGVIAGWNGSALNIGLDVVVLALIGLAARRRTSPAR